MDAKTKGRIQYFLRHHFETKACTQLGAPKKRSMTIDDFTIEASNGEKTMKRRAEEYTDDEVVCTDGPGTSEQHQDADLGDM